MENTDKDIQRLNAENIDIKRRLEKLETNDERHESDIRELYKAQEGTKVYVTQILQKLESMETKFFSLFTSMATSQDKERNAERKERSKTMQNWIDFAKFIVAATLGAVIFYLFQQGG